MSTKTPPPFDVEADPYTKNNLEPGFYDKILPKDNIQKDIIPFEIKTSIHNCFACEHKKFHKPLELSNFDASVMVIGQTTDDVNFTTDEGKLLADTLLWAGFNMDDVYLTSMTKCADEDVPEQCQHHLLSELLCVRPRVVIALGYDVGKHFDPAITQAGAFSTILNSMSMLTTYRVSYAMQEESLYHQFCYHLQQAKVSMDSPQ